jgi:hypothetical protein
MRIRPRILLGVAAVALPLTSFVVISTPSLFAGAAAPVFPVACKTAGTVTFSPALTLTGTQTTNSAAVTTVTITSGKMTACLSGATVGAPGHGDYATTSFNIPATSLGRIDGVKTYATGYCPTFFTAPTLKDLRGMVFNITWTGGEGGTSLFTVKKAALATNNASEVGFNLSAKSTGLGSYAEKSINQITAFIDATDSAAIMGGCSASQTVSTATFDQSNSVAIL